MFNARVCCPDAVEKDTSGPWDLLLLCHSEAVCAASLLAILEVPDREREEAQGDLQLIEGIQGMERSPTGTRGKSELSQEELVGFRMG